MRTFYIITLNIFFYSSLAAQSFKVGPFTGKHISLPIVADFNGDEKLDVVGVSRFFSPTGALKLHKNVSQPDSIIFETLDLGIQVIGEPGFGDFDDDGDVDLVVTRSSDSTILILLNKGAGSFESYPQDSEVAYGFRTSDMDGDQDIDIVAFNEIEHSVFLMMNDGNGAFESKNLLTNEDDLYTVELGDLDLDEDMDIIIGYNGFFEGKITELENQGSNDFLEKNIKEHAIDGLDNIQIIDIDHDGDNDIAYSSTSSSTLLAMINNGNKTYTNTNLVQGLGGISSFKIADYNTDGIMDIMLGCYSADNTYHQGLSDNSFEYDSEVVTGIQPMFFIANGDFDSDNDLDAILSNGDFWWISNELEQSHVGIPEVADAPYSVFPNPFNNSLELHVDFEKVDIYISDQLGKILMRTTDTLPLNLGFLKEGLYFLSIVDRKSGKFVQTSKIIKTR